MKNPTMTHDTTPNRGAEDTVQSALAESHPEHPTPYSREECPHCDPEQPEPVAGAIRELDGISRAGFNRGELTVEFTHADPSEVVDAADEYGWKLKTVRWDENQFVFRHPETPEDVYPKDIRTGYSPTSDEVLMAGDISEPDSEELEAFKKRQQMFQCECGEQADGKVTVHSEGATVSQLNKNWVTIHTATEDGNPALYFHIHENEVDRGADLRNILKDDTEDVETDPEPRDPRDPRPDSDGDQPRSNRKRRNPDTRGPRTDGGTRE